MWRHWYLCYTRRFAFSIVHDCLLLGLSKGKTRVEIPVWFFFRSVANCSQDLNTHAPSQVLNTHAQRLDSDEHCAMAEEEKSLRWKIIARTVYNTLKTHTIYAHRVCGRLTLEMSRVFGKPGSVRQPSLWEISSWANIHEWTFYREICYITWA